MYVNYYTQGMRWVKCSHKGYFIYEPRDILVFNLTDCVWMVPGTMSPDKE